MVEIMTQTPKGVTRKIRKETMTKGKTVVMKELGLIRHWDFPAPKLFKDDQRFDAETENGPYDAPVCGYLAKVTIPEEQCVEYDYPFHFGEVVLVFGDIAKMPGHCAFATKGGRIHFGYHTEDFAALTDEEI
jgi:hypothetical protein